MTLAEVIGSVLLYATVGTTGLVSSAPRGQAQQEGGLGDEW